MSLWITKIAFLFILNAAALYAAEYFVDGFEISGGNVDFAIVAAIFTLINIFIKPVVKLVLSPLIIITLGLGLLFVNAAMLYFLDFISSSVIINGVTPLAYATIIISIVHFVLGFFIKKLT
jgi:putative membrane protein